MKNIEERKFIKKCFKILEEEHPEKFEIIEIIDDDIIVPDNMLNQENKQLWKLVEADIQSDDIEKMEKEFKITLPSIYKNFITMYYHIFEELDGVFDDFFDEDDREVTVDIFPQLSDKPFEIIRQVFHECEGLIRNGYIPFCDLNENGPLCFDTKNENIIVWFDHEEYYKCTNRIELENIAIVIFDDFKQFMECFFCGKRHVVGN